MFAGLDSRPALSYNSRHGRNSLPVDDAVAVDGKALRGAVRPDGTQVHLLSAFLQDQGVTVAQARSLDGAQRNPGSRGKPLIPFVSAKPDPDSAALHPG